MKYSEVREMLLRHWAYTGGPNEAHSVEIYHDDALLELPQSHERRETLYFAEPFDAPEWREPWRAEGPLSSSADLPIRVRGGS